MLLVGLLGVALGGGRPVEAPPPEPVGSHPQDTVQMGDVPILAHLAASMPLESPRTPEALLTHTTPPYLTAPDPTALLAAQAERHRGPEGGERLRVLTFNTTLLDRRHALGLKRTRSPWVPARRVHLPDRILDDDWDVVLLQEVWDWTDVVRFAVEAEHHGYVWHAGSEKRHNEHGLMILIKGTLVEGPQQRTEGTFADQRRCERWPGPGIRRGYLTWSFTHTPTGRRVRVATAQPTPGAEHWHTRDLQVRQLGADLGQTPEDTVLIVGLDLGAAPVYLHDTFGQVRGRPVRGWWSSASAWALLQHYSGATDLFTWGAHRSDVVASHALPDWNPAWLRLPLGGRCDLQPTDHFTTTDCNRLQFDAGAGESPPARQDVVLARAPEGSLHVGDVGLAYTEPEQVGGRTQPLSTHYGVAAELQLTPLP